MNKFLQPASCISVPYAARLRFPRLFFVNANLSVPCVSHGRTFSWSQKLRGRCRALFLARSSLSYGCNFGGGCRALFRWPAFRCGEIHIVRLALSKKFQINVSKNAAKMAIAILISVTKSLVFFAVMSAMRTHKPMQVRIVFFSAVRAGLPYLVAHFILLSISLACSILCSSAPRTS